MLENTKIKYMRNPINKLFGDKTIVTKIQKKLPFLFQLARNGKPKRNGSRKF